MKKNKLRITVTLALTAFASLLCSGCWYIEQASGYLSDRFSAVPLPRYVQKHEDDAELKALYQSTKEVRDFAVNELGLKPTKNYTSIVQNTKGYVATVVSACASDSFERYQWNYPFVGKMPYRGFYDTDKAKKLAADLKQQGYDVFVRNVEAFSSLGYFTDPLYSFMKTYPEDEIAELIIHESVHTTLYVKGDPQFSEEFATFVGRKAALLYIRKKYGNDSPLILHREDLEHDQKLFVDFLKETARQLEAVYSDTSLTREEKLTHKAEIIQSRAIEYAGTYSAELRIEGYRKFSMAGINNAYIDLYRLYEEDLSLYETWLTEKCGGNLKAFIEDMKKLAKEYGKDIKAGMRKELAEVSFRAKESIQL